MTMTMTKFNADTNIIIRYAKAETKAQIINVLKTAKAKAAIVNADLVVYGADRGLVDTLLGLADVKLYGVTAKGDSAEITDSAQVFGVDVVAEFLADRAAEFDALVVKTDAALDAVDALLGIYGEGEAEVVEVAVVAVVTHFEVSFGGKDFSKSLREVKKVEGARFDGTRKVWTIPVTTTQDKRDWLTRCFCTVTAVYGAK